MHIIDTKTGVSFNSRTTADRAGFAAIVSRRLGNTETGVYRVVFSTRGQAYRAACKACESLARNHAYVN